MKVAAYEDAHPEPCILSEGFAKQEFGSRRRRKRGAHVEPLARLRWRAQRPPTTKLVPLISAYGDWRESFWSIRATGARIGQNSALVCQVDEARLANLFEVAHFVS